MKAQAYLQMMRAHFDERQAAYPLDDVRVVGWGSRESQEARFRALCEVGNFNGCSLLDVGCGVADLYAYVKRRGWRVSYHGLDLSSRVVAHARKRFRGIEVRIGNAVTGRLSGTYDYVVASGIFFIPSPAWPELVVRTLRKMLRAARLGVAANFLSRYGGSNIQDFRADPAEVLTLCLTRVSPWVTLRHDYRANDFTVYLYHEQISAKSRLGKTRDRSGAQ